MNKKILILSILTLLLIILLSVGVSAATITSAEVTITPSKTECKAGETIDYTVSLKNLNASSGILGFGAYIEYDSNLLILNTKAKGLSDWSDATISESTNRFVTTKDSHSSNNEDILKITFTAKEATINTETTIKLKKIEISNGSQYNISEVSANKITITPKSAGTVTPPIEQNPDDNKNNPENNEQNSNTTPTKPANNTVNDAIDSSTSEKIPATGVNNYLSIIILILAIISVVSFVKIKVLDKRISKQNQDFIEKDENKR